MAGERNENLRLILNQGPTVRGNLECPTNFSLSSEFDNLKLVEHYTDLEHLAGSIRKCYSVNRTDRKLCIVPTAVRITNRK